MFKTPFKLPLRARTQCALPFRLAPELVLTLRRDTLEPAVLSSCSWQAPEAAERVERVCTLSSTVHVMRTPKIAEIEGFVQED